MTRPKLNATDKELQEEYLAYQREANNILYRRIIPTEHEKRIHEEHATIQRMQEELDRLQATLSKPWNEYARRKWRPINDTAFQCERAANTIRYAKERISELTTELHHAPNTNALIQQQHTLLSQAAQMLHEQLNARGIPIPTRGHVGKWGNSCVQSLISLPEARAKIIEFFQTI